MASGKARPRAFIYARVSRDPKQVSRSLDEQEAECRGDCDREGWDVTRVFSDRNRGASRHAKGDRPGYNDLLASIDQCDVLVMWEQSRGQRDLKDFVTLRDLCAKHSVLWSIRGRTYDMSRTQDRRMAAYEAVNDEAEADVTRERILRSTRANAAMGRPHGKLLYGYRREYDPSTGALVGQVIDRAHAAVIREASERFLAGETPNAIAADFNRRGITAARGGKWTLTQIRRLLTNPAMNGKRIHRGEIYPAVWPAILDDSTFRQCTTKFADPSRRTSRDSSVKHLLTGIAKCGVCGAPMKYGKPRGKPSYVCWGNFCVARHMAQTEAIVTELILARLEMPDARVLFERQDAESETIYEEIAVKRVRLVEFYDEAAAGGITAHALGRIESALLGEISDLEKNLQRADVPAVLAQMADQPRTIWADLSITQRRDVIRSLVEIRVLRMRKGARPVPPESIAVEWIGRS